MGRKRGRGQFPMFKKWAESAGTRVSTRKEAKERRKQRGRGQFLMSTTVHKRGIERSRRAMRPGVRFKDATALWRTVVRHQKHPRFLVRRRQERQPGMGKTK